MPAPRKNRSIAELESWTADPARLARLESLILVCQRAVFIKALLGLSASTERIRRHVRLVCERHGVDLRVGHGPGYDGVHLRQANLQQRYICSLLLGWLLGSSDGGIERTDQGLDPDRLLDRMLYCYQRYLDQFVTTAARADVSFEMFYTLYQACAVGDVSLHRCGNCGSQFIMLRTAHLITCHICAVHHHAQMPPHYWPVTHNIEAHEVRGPQA